jgi:zona occludens toxin
MITIITGTPGAGKTLYAVTKLLRKLLGETFTGKDDDGNPVEKSRRIFTNIKGLTLDHERIDGNGEWMQDSSKAWHFKGNSGGLRDWHLWAKPGDVIVFDEVQEVWKPRPNGSAVPPDIQALETHRHMGVDFILITQGIALTERNLSMLCGRHLHVRRVAGMPFAIVYEWDSASRTLLFSKAMAKEKWWYDRSGYKLYKSAELHTKSSRRLPAVLWVLVFAIVALGALTPLIYTRYGERFGWTKPVTLPGAEKAAVAGSGPAAAASPMAAASAPVSGAGEKPAVFVGCAASKTRCTCYDSDDKQVVKELEWCRTQALVNKPPQQSLAWLRIPDQELHERQLQALDRADTELVRFAVARGEAQRRSEAPASAPAPLQSKTPERSAGTLARAGS